MTSPTDRLAAELVALLGTGRQIPPPSARDPDFGPEAAAAVAAAVHARRTARGERPVGRKIGYADRPEPASAVDAVVWSHVYDTTLHAPGTLAVAGLAEPGIEPEIVLRLGRAPAPEMDAAALLACVDAVAHGFEIVASVYPGYRSTGPDATAAFGLHGGLVLGPLRAIDGDRAAWGAALAGFTVTLLRDGAPVAETDTAAFGGGPLASLGHLVRRLAAERGAPPLAPGELVSTGALTDTFPVAPGQTWSTRLAGIDLPGLSLTIA